MPVPVGANFTLWVYPSPEALVELLLAAPVDDDPFEDIRATRAARHLPNDGAFVIRDGSIAGDAPDA